MVLLQRKIDDQSRELEKVADELSKMKQALDHFSATHDVAKEEIKVDGRCLSLQDLIQLKSYLQLTAYQEKLEVIYSMLLEERCEWNHHGMRTYESANAKVLK